MRPACVRQVPFITSPATHAHCQSTQVSHSHTYTPNKCRPMPKANLCARPDKNRKANIRPDSRQEASRFAETTYDTARHDSERERDRILARSECQTWASRTSRKVSCYHVVVKKDKRETMKYNEKLGQHVTEIVPRSRCGALH